MDNKLYDSELKVMGVLWREGDCTARHIADVLAAEVGWNVNTTYTLIKRCIAKGAVARSEPKFMCHALVERAAVQKAQTDELIGKLYDGHEPSGYVRGRGRGDPGGDRGAGRLHQPPAQGGVSRAVGGSGAAAAGAGERAVAGERVQAV